MKLKIFFALGLFSVWTSASPTNLDLDAYAKNFRETLEALVQAETTNPPGNESRAVAIFEKELKAQGIDFNETEFAPGRKNLVARLKGNGHKKPVMLLAHTDVVGTEDQNWATPPHQLTEKDGNLYGRGVYDDLGVAVMNMEAFIALKKSGMELDRDVILALTGDEESGGQGLRYLLEKFPETVDAEIALNEGGRPNVNHDGKVNFFYLQVAEKTYQDFTLTARGESGHSASPKSNNNAIYNLSRALSRLSQAKPEYRLLPLMRQFFRSAGPIEQGQLGKAMTAMAESKIKLPKEALEVLLKSSHFAGLLATSCVPTLINGGVRANVLPVKAVATVNCRILPDETVEQVQKRLADIVNDSKIEIEMASNFGPGLSTPLSDDFLAQVTGAASEVWPGVTVIPSMQSGMTDSRMLRAKHIQAYGLTGLATKNVPSHGANEKIAIASIRPGIDFTYRLLVKLAAAKAKPSP